MPDPRPPQDPSFRRRFRTGDMLFGTVIKTPAPHIIEVLGDVGFDFFMIDGEHAAFDRAGIDIAILAARAVGVPGIVRVADESSILSALDLGATGVLVPHVATGAQAHRIAAACRYRGGRRGFANTTRAGRYGLASIAQHVEASDAAVTVIAMIEDPEALDDIDAITATEGIDGVFLGRGDLAVAMGQPAMDAPPVRQATERIAASARRAGKAIFGVASSDSETAWLKSIGTTTFLVSSDHGFMRQAATAALAKVRA